MSVDEAKRKKPKAHPIKKIFTVLATSILSLVLILIITGTIVATALTVYIMNFMEADVDIDLYNLDMKSISFIYAYDKDGTPVEIGRISKDDYRIAVELEQIPEHVQNAFVYTEDERFFEHSGVDFRRVLAAVINELMPGGDDNRFGGSTITQQFIKNYTKDSETAISRKIREIFRATQLEQKYSKDEILKAYLNYIGMGGNVYGVQAAANRYFGKDISEVTIAEAASLAAIAKSTETLRPDLDQKHYDKNMIRQKVVLSLMLKNGAISLDEYNQAVNEEVIVLGINDDKRTEEPEEQPEDSEAEKTEDSDTEDEKPKKKVQSYFVDMVIEDVAADFMKLYGITKEEAMDKLRSGGYYIYATVDLEMQEEIENKFLNPKTFTSKELEDPPQASFISMDYKGNILAVVGGIGEKPSALCYNRATMSKRSPGSCIKPISTYGYGITNDLIHWSSVFIDEPIEIMDWSIGDTRKWPKNYSNVWTEQKFFTYEALQKSLNTVVAQLCQMETPQQVFNFTQSQMGIESLVLSRDVDGKIKSDVDLSPLSVGALTDGVTLKNLVTSYQAFGNAGMIYEPTSYTKVTDYNGKVILEHKYTARQAIDPESAYVMNKLMQTVVESGTGTAANLGNGKLIGKTGTSQDWTDLLFIGCTPNTVSGVWYGYDEQFKKDEDGSLLLDRNGKPIPYSAYQTYDSSSMIWRRIYGDIALREPISDFPPNSQVKELHFCKITGLIAGPRCPASDKPGYYKPSNIPETCTGIHDGSVAETIAPEVTLPPSETRPNENPAVSTTRPPAVIID